MKTSVFLAALAISSAGIACSDSRNDVTQAGVALSTATPAPSAPAPANGQPMVDTVKITILSDMMPGRHTAAEWGFSALVEVSAGGVSKRFLFDTGGAPQTVVSN